MRAENTDQRRAGHNPLQPLGVAEAHRLATAAVWPGWNAVEWPRRRSDDPQDRYFDRFTSGLAAEEATRMRPIEVLFARFRHSSMPGSAPGSASLRALGQASSMAQPIVCGDLPIRYRPKCGLRTVPVSGANGATANSSRGIERYPRVGV